MPLASTFIFTNIEIDYTTIYPWTARCSSNIVGFFDGCSKVEHGLCSFERCPTMQKRALNIILYSSSALRLEPSPSDTPDTHLPDLQAQFKPARELFSRAFSPHTGRTLQPVLCSSWSLGEPTHCVAFPPGLEHDHDHTPTSPSTTSGRRLNETDRSKERGWLGTNTDRSGHDDSLPLTKTRTMWVSTLQPRRSPPSATS
jgi:hypothetical protein